MERDHARLICHQTGEDLSRCVPQGGSHQAHGSAVTFVQDSVRLHGDRCVKRQCLVRGGQLANLEPGFDQAEGDRIRDFRGGQLAGPPAGFGDALTGDRMRQQNLRYVVGGKSITPPQGLEKGGHAMGVKAR